MSANRACFALALAAACGGRAPAPAHVARSSDAAQPDRTAPPTGAASISAAELRAHVELLASDELRGRETLAPGYQRAADYLAREMNRYGLAPLPGHDDFQVAYTLYELGYDDAHTSLSAGGTAYALGRDFAVFPFSDEGVAEGPVVFAGYGITAPELNWDDYAGLDVAGKIVLVLRHHPGEGDGKADEAFRQHALFATKAANARRHGAAAMLLVTDPLHHDDGDDLRSNAIWLTQPLDERMRERMQRARQTRDGAPLVALHVSRSVATALVAGAGRSLADLQRAVDGGDKPAAIANAGTVATVSVRARTDARVVTPVDVIGYLEGSDPALRDEWIVVGAHFDHLGAYDGAGDTVYNGADDNASGTAGMLELAQAFASRARRPKRSLVFIGFSGEEKGLLGSRALVDQHILPIERVVFMLNLDMIGRNPSQPVAVVGDGYGTGVREAVAAANAAVGLPIEFGGAEYSGNSDHHPFYASDVPFAFFFTGLHDDYHQLSDHADKLAYDRMADIVRVAYGTVDAIASGAVTPTFIHHVDWLGIEVQARGGDAVVTAVAGGSRAAGAGLAAGDVIRAIGGTPLADPRDVGKRFREWEPGTAQDLVVARGGATRSVHVARAKRGYLGVFPGPVDADARKALGLSDDEGVRIRGVAPDGPAGKAGLREGDIVIRIRGLPVNLRTLGTHLARIGAGEPVQIVIVRDGERKTLDLVLGERPQRP